MGLFLLVLTGFRRIDALPPPSISVHGVQRRGIQPGLCGVSKARAPSCLHLQLFGVMPFYLLTDNQAALHPCCGRCLLPGEVARKTSFLFLGPHITMGTPASFVGAVSARFLTYENIPYIAVGFPMSLFPFGSHFLPPLPF